MRNSELLPPGLISIPIIIGLIIMLTAIPLAIKLVSQNQNLQNRAANYDSPTNNTVPCVSFNSAYIKYCQNPLISRELDNEKYIPCNQIQTALNSYCSSSTIRPSPTIIKPPPLPTSKLKPTPTTVSSCKDGQQRCLGSRILIRCIRGQWKLITVCKQSCSPTGCQ